MSTKTVGTVPVSYHSNVSHAINQRGQRFHWNSHLVVLLSFDARFSPQIDYWYMGKVPPMGANVAYSLYGALKGEKFSGCSEKTFINSFYTNTGFQDFAQAMYYAGQSGFSSYAYDDDSYGAVSAGCNGGYGVGCDATYGFAVHTYSTDTCNPEWVNGVKDPLYDLNSAFEASTCVKIYDSSSYSGYSSGTALQLLSYSSACFYQNFYSPDGECPDPYGKIRYYRQNFANGLKREKRAQPFEIYTHEVKKGKILVGLGLLLSLVASSLLFIENRKARTVKKGKHSLSDTGSDGLVKSSPDQGEKHETKSYSVFRGWFSKKDDVEMTDMKAHEEEFSPPEPLGQPNMSMPPPPPSTQMAPMTAPPPPPPSAAPQPAQFQQIFPSPLSSRDESVPDQYNYAPNPAANANLSLLADALQPTGSADKSVEQLLPTASADKSVEQLQPTTSVDKSVEQLQPTESDDQATDLLQPTASADKSVEQLQPTGSVDQATNLSGLLQPSASADQSLGQGTQSDVEPESTPNKTDTNLKLLADALQPAAASAGSAVDLNFVDEVTLSRASMDSDLVAASASRDSVGDATADSSVVMDRILSDKMDAVLANREEEGEILSPAEDDAVVVSHEDAPSS